MHNYFYRALYEAAPESMRHSSQNPLDAAQTASVGDTSQIQDWRIMLKSEAAACVVVTEGRVDSIALQGARIVLRTRSSASRTALCRRCVGEKTE